MKQNVVKSNRRNQKFQFVHKSKLCLQCYSSEIAELLQKHGAVFNADENDASSGVFIAGDADDDGTNCTVLRAAEFNPEIVSCDDVMIAVLCEWLVTPHNETL